MLTIYILWKCFRNQDHKKNQQQNKQKTKKPNNPKFNKSTKQKGKKEKPNTQFSMSSLNSGVFLSILKPFFSTGSHDKSYMMTSPENYQKFCDLWCFSLKSQFLWLNNSLTRLAFIFWKKAVAFGCRTNFREWQSRDWVCRKIIMKFIFNYHVLFKTTLYEFWCLWHDCRVR